MVTGIHPAPEHVPCGSLDRSRFFTLSLDLLAISDLAGTILDISPSVRDLLGFTEEELIGNSYRMLVHPDEQARVQDLLEAFRQGRDAIRFEFRAVCKDGSVRWMESTCPAPKGESEYLYSIVRDITERKYLRDSLLEWRNRYEAAMQACRGIVYEWNSETGETICGGNYQQMLGYSLSELPRSSQNWYALVHPDDRATIERSVAIALQNRQDLHLTYRLRRKDGIYIQVRSDAQFCADAEGRRIRVVGFLTDLSEQLQSEEKFRRTFESAPTGMVIVNDKGVILFVNPTVTALFGYSAEELVGQPIDKIVPLDRPPRSRSAQLDPADRATSRTMGSNRERIGRRKNGSEIPVEVGFSSIPSQNDVWVVCTIIDLSERYRAFNAVRETEQRLSQIVNNSSAVVYVKRLDGTYLLINRQYEKLFQVTLDQVRNRTDHEIFSRELADIFRHNDQQVVQTGAVLQMEEIAPHADGPHHYVSVKFPLRDTQGDIYAVAGISTDITQHVRAEQEVERLKDRMALILDSVGDGIIGVDLDQRITFANRAAEQQLGWSGAELMGQSWPALVGQPPGVIAPPEEAAKSMEETSLRRRDGSQLPVELVASAIQDKGRPLGAVFAFHDMTERIARQKVEQELQTARTIQARLYPEAAPFLAGFDIAGAVFPAALACGDYYDFVPLPHNRLAVMIGDVSGHGIVAALEMIELRSFLRATLHFESTLEVIVSRLNEFLAQDLPDDLFVSLFCSILDGPARRLDYVGAGHDAYLLRADGNDIHLDSSTTLLGIVPTLDPVVSSITLEAGDVLLLATDGIMETFAACGKQFGWRRMVQTVRACRDLPAEAMVQSLVREVRAHASSPNQADDISAIIVKAL